MDAGLLIAIVVVLVLLALLAFVAGRQRRSRRLQDRFGPEYDRTVEQAGDRRAAETELRERAERREQFDIVPLEPEAHSRYIEAWRHTQAQFVDEPVEATREADRLITAVMRDRGYPIDDFDQRAADISVDHPQVVDDYRAAHAIAAANDRSEASTEDLRQALVHYRSLFEELLEDRPDGHTDVADGREAEAARRADDADGREAEAARRADDADGREAEAARRADVADGREAEAARRADVADGHEAEAARRADDADGHEAEAAARRADDGRRPDRSTEEAR